MDLSGGKGGGSKFSNKGSFYSRFPLSPETPPPSNETGSAPPTFPSSSPNTPTFPSSSPNEKVGVYFVNLLT